MHVQDIMRETEGGTAATTTTAATTSAADLIPRSEAQQAFKARDEIKRKQRELEEAGLIMTPEQKAEVDTLRANAAKAEEERAKKAGEFDSLRVNLIKQHEAQLQTEREAKTKAEQELSSTLRGLAFAQAADWFGPNGKTVLTPEIAEAYFGRYVDLDGRTVVVKDADGHVILDLKTGKPAAFADAIGQLIASLPNKDAVLRGSGKTGSGNSGGSRTTDAGIDVDVRRAMSATELRDPAVRAKLKQQMANAGGLQVAAGLNRR